MNSDPKYSAAKAAKKPDKQSGGGLNDLLKQAQEAVEQLIRALREEYAALTSNNLPGFEAAIHKKIACTSQLELIEQNLFSLLRNAGYSFDKAGLTAYVETLNSPAEKRAILHHWQQLHDAIAQCQNQNQVNGRILNIASLNIRQALEVLTGQKSGNTYSANGKPKDGGKGDKIAIA